MDDTAFVLISDIGYFHKAKKTIADLRYRGEWKGDIVFITIDFQLNTNFKNYYNIIEVSFPKIDKSILLSKIGKGFSVGDKREINKILQWEKIHVFDEYFAKWKRIVFIDAGLRIFYSVDNLLNLDYKGKILAPNDAGYYDKKEAIFNCQISHDDKKLVEKIREDFGYDILFKDYFLNCMWIYDTEILKICGKKDLIHIMNEYPLCKNNEMTAMNLLFTFKHKLWQEFPKRADNGKYLFEWCESNHPHSTTWRDYCCIKYPITIRFDDT